MTEYKIPEDELPPPGTRYLSAAKVCEKVGRKSTWLYRTMADDKSFPKPIRMGLSPVWIESDIDRWVIGQARTNPRSAGSRHYFKKKAA